MQKTLRKQLRFTNSRDGFDPENRKVKFHVIVLSFTIILFAPAGRLWAQAMVPPTGMEDANKPMPMDERFQRRFPQPVRVGDLIGLPVLDDSLSTLGHVREVVRNADGTIALIVSYGGWFGFGARPVAVPVQVVGIMGRELASLDMPRSDFAAAPTWQGAAAQVLADDATIRVALARR